MERFIFAHTDYRAYLAEHFERRKKVQKGWSKRAWARSLGLAGPSMLTMILQKRRQPGEKLISKLCQQLKLDAKEERYFRDLIELEKAGPEGAKRVFVLERLAGQRPGGDFQELSRESFAAISKWHYYAIREMVLLESFHEDPEWISSCLQFRVTPSEVRTAIRTLLKLGLLARDAEGKLRMAGGNTETTSDIVDEGVKRFHEQALENARVSLRSHLPAIREMRGTTLAVSREKLSEAKLLIQKFHREFVALTESSHGDAVYQLEVAFYPVAIAKGAANVTH